MPINQSQAFMATKQSGIASAAGLIGARRFAELLRKMQSGTATPQEAAEFEALRSNRGAGTLGALEWAVPAAIAAGNIAGIGKGAGAGATGSAGGAANIGPTVAGAGGGAAAASGGFLKSAFGQILVNTGINLATSLWADRSNRQSEARARQAVRDYINQAVQQLSPDNLQALYREFLPQTQAALSPFQQTATQQFQSSAARAGLQGSPYALAAEAGLRGQLANQSTQAAFERAMQTAQQRAGIFAGAAGTAGGIPTQPSTLPGALAASADQAYLIRVLTQRQQQTANPNFTGFSSLFNQPNNTGAPYNPYRYR